MLKTGAWSESSVVGRAAAGLPPGVSGIGAPARWLLWWGSAAPGSDAPGVEAEIEGESRWCGVCSSAWWYAGALTTPVPAVGVYSAEGVPGAAAAAAEDDDEADSEDVEEEEAEIWGRDSKGLERSCPLGPARGVRSWAELDGQNLSILSLSCARDDSEGR